MNLFELLDTVEKPEGRARAKAYLASLPFPHFEAHPAVQRAYIRIDSDGTRLAGRFVERKFVALESELPRRSNSGTGG
jgi:hypothetical protein